MTDVSDFKQQEWLNKEQELLRLADYICAEEECTESATQAHICYYLGNTSIWKLPAGAYKCYCKKHREERRSAEGALRIMLAAFTTNELEVLHRNLEVLGGLPVNKRGDRAQIIEQVFAESKKKLESNSFMMQWHGDNAFEDEDNEEFDE